MKAAILKDKRTLVVEEVPTPKAGPGDIILKMKYTGICGSDLHLYSTGLLPPDTIMGHECSGIVAELGDGVEGWSVGEKVGLYGALFCGKCFWCRRGHTNLCREMGGIGIGDMPGGYAEYLRVFPSMLLKVPDNVTSRDLALMDPFATAYHAVRLSGFQVGDTALVMGAGPIGLCVIHHLKLAGARLVAATERVEKRAQTAKQFGADIVMNPQDDVLDKLADLTNSVGVDYVFECVGVPDTTQEAFNLVRRAGKVVLVGVCMEPATVQPVLWIIKEVSMQTTLGFTRAEFEDILDFMHKGIIKADNLVSETVSLDDVPQAFERLLSPNTELKVLVEFED
ncbi:MAG: alcohol dehydrogenase catalytic domain-containing protein [Candidatus Lindowbacteria bacterium]|nr:alcohol dehydrogenase catalytic domain-containing protein [Candidatus Lindowbacteria bacterium]